MTRGQRVRVMDALRDEFRKQCRDFETRFYLGEWDEAIAAGQQVGIAVAVDPRDYVTLELVEPEDELEDFDADIPEAS